MNGGGDNAFVERRETPCLLHSGMQRSIDVHDGEIKDLQEDRKRIFQILDEVQRTQAAMLIQMEHGFKDANAAISSLTQEVAKVISQRDAFSMDYYKTIKDLRDEIQQLKEFKWFSDTLTRWRDRLPWIVTGVAVAAMGYIILRHYWIDLGQFLLGRVK